MLTVLAAVLVPDPTSLPFLLGAELAESAGDGGGPGGGLGMGPREGDGPARSGGTPAGGEMIWEARGAWLPLLLGGETTLGRVEEGGEMTLGEFE